MTCDYDPLKVDWERSSFLKSLNVMIFICAVTRFALRAGGDAW